MQITTLGSSSLLILRPLGLLLLNVAILSMKETRRNIIKLSYDFLVPCNSCLIPCASNPTIGQF
jgi:hypothetical protein